MIFLVFIEQDNYRYEEKKYLNIFISKSDLDTTSDTNSYITLFVGRPVVVAI